MSGRKRLKVVLCWHMHQPEYRSPSGEYRLPWTYLHAIKDYADMAAHLEQAPRARAVVNFVPILLEQIADYAHQIQNFLSKGEAIRDPLLSLLDNPVMPAALEERSAVIRACLRANERRLIRRFPPYLRLVEMARWLEQNPPALDYLSDQYLSDLLVWYHLAWLGESVRRSDERVKRLIDKGANFTLHERRLLLTVIGEVVGGILDRYARLAERGQIELSMTPYAHPIAPLLLDITSARQSQPEVPLPLLQQYPGGAGRVRWHIEHGIEVFEQFFGVRPQGCWPAEGGVSTEFVDLLGEYGFRWAASGENVLRNSLAHAVPKPTGSGMHQAYRVGAGNTACFFRDDGLSDLIGFSYQDWHADDAVADLTRHLENIAAAQHEPGRVVSIIMDGENAWEAYPENGYYFLTALYQRLSEHPSLELTTFADCLATNAKVASLPALVAGSWVYGTFSTWIGDRDKNRGWDMLGEAKQAYDRAVRSGRLNAKQAAAATQQLAICEGSDWFWWFGDYNPAETVSDFEHLYRMHLTHLYQLLGEEPPEYLARTFTIGAGSPAHGGVMRPGKAST